MVQSVGYTPQRANGIHVAIAWVFAVLSIGYFLPWAIAATRGKSNSIAIALLNFFVGWTIIGWIVAFAMACGTESHHVSNVSVAVGPSGYPHALHQQSLPPAGWYPQGAGQRYWDGQQWTEHTAG